VVKLLRFVEKAEAFTRITGISADFSLNTEQGILTAEYAEYTEKKDSIHPPPLPRIPRIPRFNFPKTD
jgi:hypothetical protein